MINKICCNCNKKWQQQLQVGQGRGHGMLLTFVTDKCLNKHAYILKYIHICYLHINIKIKGVLVHTYRKNKYGHIQINIGTMSWLD